jgi:hypothetical protein
MSGLPPIATELRTSLEVWFVPIVLRKSQNAMELNSAKRQNKRQPSIDVASDAPPKSVVSSSQNEVVPHINIRSPRLQPGKFVIGETKRLLQHYLPLAAVSNHSNQTPFVVGTTPPAQIVHVGTSRPSVLAVLRHERQRPPEPPPLRRRYHPSLWRGFSFDLG